MTDCKKTPRVLLVNPPVYDFSAYDLWLRPLGLLRIGAILKASGCDVRLIDALDRDNPIYAEKGLSLPPLRKDGAGPFYRQRVKKPDTLKDVKRYFHRFGMPEGILAEEIRKLTTSGWIPDAVLITSLFTYWYPGVQSATKEVKKNLPGVKIFVGGVYAKLCPEHARKHLPDSEVIEDENVWLKSFLQSFGLEIKEPEIFADYSLFSYPIRHAAVSTSFGCPFSCEYCASEIISGKFHPRLVGSILNDIQKLSGAGVSEFAFYDDAFLYQSQTRAIPLFEEIIRLDAGLKFHFPNGLHVRYLDKRMAELFMAAGVKTIRLSFETVRPASFAASSFKARKDEYLSAVNALTAAGYNHRDIGTYVLAGLPGQYPREVHETMRFIHSAGGYVVVTIFSPVPKTRTFKKAVSEGLDPDEPLFQNNIAYAELFGPFRNGEFKKIRDTARKLNQAYLKN